MTGRSIRYKNLISVVKSRAQILPKADSTNNATQKYPMNRATSLRVPKEDLLLARGNESRTNGKEPKIVLISIWSKRKGKPESVEANSKR